MSVDDGDLGDERVPRAGRRLEVSRPSSEREPLAHAEQADAVRVRSPAKPRPSSSITAVTAPPLRARRC